MLPRKLARFALALLLLCVPVACVMAQDGYIRIKAFEDEVTQAPADQNPIDPEQADPEQGVEILISAVGDVTLGGNRKGNPASTIYTREYEAQGGNYGFPFRNVRDLFSQDDMTLINFEGVLTNNTKPRNAGNEFLFRIEPEHVQALTLGNIEAVTLENNHSLDFGEQGLRDTIEALTGQNITYCGAGHMGVYTVKGVSIAMLGYQTFGNAYDAIHSQMPLDVAAAKAEHDIVIVSYHWGEEKDYAPHDRQVQLGRATIDAGADLVLGHHSHRINPIEFYEGRYIVYSLANFSFSGNSKPSDMNSFIFQIKFNVRDGVAQTGAFRVLPIRISSVPDTNDFAPTLYEPGSADARNVVETMKKEGKNLRYAVDEYPVDWP